MKETYRDAREEESLREYRKLCKEKEVYYRNNEKRILRAIANERKNDIRLRMPGLLKSGHVVKCRNFSVSLTGRPCRSLECVYKDRKEDVVQGCMSCMKFQISKGAGLWV